MKVDRADIQERIRKAVNAERTGHKMRPLRLPTGAQIARAAMHAIAPELDLLERLTPGARTKEIRCRTCSCTLGYTAEMRQCADCKRNNRQD